MTLQQRLAQILEERALQQSELADSAGIDRADISRLLHDEKPRFTVRTILKLSRGLRLTPKELVEGVDEIPEKLHDDLAWWIQQFTEAEAAIKERDELRQTLRKTLDSIQEQLCAVEQRQAEELQKLRAALSELREARDRALDLHRAVESRANAADLKLDGLERQLEDAERREQTLVAEIAELRTRLAESKKQTVATGILGALFGAGAGALLKQASNEAELDDDEA